MILVLQLKWKTNLLLIFFEYESYELVKVINHTCYLIKKIAKNQTFDFCRAREGWVLYKPMKIKYFFLSAFEGMLYLIKN